MTSRERVFQAIRHEEPDRVPFNARFTDKALAAYQKAAGITGDLAEHFGHDVRYVSLRVPPRPPGTERSAWRPSPTDAAVADCAAEAGSLRDRGLAVCGSYFCGVYEEAKECLGDVATLTMAYDDPAGLEALIEGIAQWKMSLYGAYARAGVDIVWIGDDLGTQNSLIMKPEHYRRFYQPWHRRIVAHLRGINPDAFVAFHSCGYVTPPSSRRSWTLSRSSGSLAGTSRSGGP